MHMTTLFFTVKFIHFNEKRCTKNEFERKKNKSNQEKVFDLILINFVYVMLFLIYLYLIRVRYFIVHRKCHSVK